MVHKVYKNRKLSGLQNKINTFRQCTKSEHTTASDQCQCHFCFTFIPEVDRSMQEFSEDE